MVKHTDMVGKQFINKHKEVCIVINYFNYDNVQIRTTNGYIKNTSLKYLKSGNWKTPYTKSVYGVGYLGTDDSNITCTKEYKMWNEMIKRVYNPNYHKKQPTYIGCSVCDEWLCFENFKKWYNNNKWNCDSVLVLDKDILMKNNKIYSPSACILVTQEINNIFTKANALRGDLPIGITQKSNKKNKYICNFSTSIINGKSFYKTYNTIEEAFNCYKKEKEKYIKDVADLYKSKYLEFPQKLYDAMYNYQVEIAD